MSDTHAHTHTHTHTHLDTVILHTYSPKKSASAAAKSRIEEKPTGGEERPKKKNKNQITDLGDVSV